MVFPDTLDKDECMIYLHGNPVDSVLSFYGKHYSGHTRFLEQHCDNLEVPTVPDDIREYVASKKDLFGLLDHQFRWLAQLEQYGYREQSMYLDYDSIWEYYPQRMLREQLNFIINFPKEQPRSPKPWVTKDILNGLEYIYGRPSSVNYD